MVKKLQYVVNEVFSNFIIMVKPTFLIIGTQKGGTTSLMRHLSRNSAIYVDMEPAFFSNNESYKKGVKEYEKKLNMGLKNHIKWMKNSKNISKKPNVIGEKTPEYMYNKKALERIKQYNPNIKLIVVLREPISRAYSQWNMYQSKTNHKFKNMTFKAMVAKYMKETNLNFSESDRFNLIKRGIYAVQLANIYDLFPKKNVLIIISEQFRTTPLPTINKICKFIGAPLFKTLQNMNYKNDVHKKNYAIPISKSEFTKLYMYYQEYNETLYKILGKPVKEWEDIYKNFFQKI